MVEEKRIISDTEKEEIYTNIFSLDDFNERDSFWLSGRRASVASMAVIDGLRRNKNSSNTPVRIRPGLKSSAPHVNDRLASQRNIRRPH